MFQAFIMFSLITHRGGGGMFKSFYSMSVRARLHAGERPQVGEVTRLSMVKN